MENNFPPKRRRLQVVLERLAEAPTAHTSLEAYKIIEELINQVEDEFLGEDSYNPPRSLIVDFEKVERLYMTKMESIFNVPNYTGVQILISHRHIIFLSRYGAIEIQKKMVEDKKGEAISFKDRHDNVLFQKSDTWGDGVWHPKNL